MKRPLLAIAILLIGSIALACNVPVFRYALERWLPDPYEVLLFHRGPLTAEQQELVKRLTDAEDQGRSNIRLHQVDLDNQDNEEAAKLFQSQAGAKAPWLMIRYPEHSGNDAIVWSGKLDSSSLVMLLQSPARQEITKRLTSGESAVWVLLESGDREQDEAAARLAEAKLKELPSVLKLPELTDDPADKLQAGPPLKIAFSLLRVKRTDPAEKFFVRMLLDSEDDLEERRVEPEHAASLIGMLGGGTLPAAVCWHGQRVRVEPMLFPVFGRGRALYAWVGKGISDDHIEEDARFLIGPCSCTVKRMNPGFDLLLTADWEGLIRDPVVTKEEPTPQLSRLTVSPPEWQAVPQKPPAVVEATTPVTTSTPIVRIVPEPASTTATPANSLWRNLIWVGLAGVVLLVTATWTLLNKQKTPAP